MLPSLQDYVTSKKHNSSNIDESIRAVLFLLQKDFTQKAQKRI